MGLDTQRVSVVIPAYRAAGTIRRAIDSVLAQSRGAAEIIVVDDGSPDEQAAVVTQTYGSRVMLLRRSNGGAAGARNVGIERASGDYIAFLDADDYWEADKLQVQLRVFGRHPELGLVAASWFEETPGQPRDGSPIRSGPGSWYDKVLRFRGPRAFRLASIVWTSTVISRREILERDRFDADLASCHDRDLWVRLVSRHPTYLTSQPVATAVLVAGSISRSSVERDKTNMLRVVERYRAVLGPFASRAWRSHTLYRWAVEDPELRPALTRLLKSFALWPLPYTGLVDVESPPLGRLRRLARLLAGPRR